MGLWFNTQKYLITNKACSEFIWHQTAGKNCFAWYRLDKKELIKSAIKRDKDRLQIELCLFDMSLTLFSFVSLYWNIYFHYDKRNSSENDVMKKLFKLAIQSSK